MDKLNPVGHPHLPPCISGVLHGAQKGGAPWEDSAENNSHNSPSCCTPGPTLSTQRTRSLTLTAALRQGIM